MSYKTVYKNNSQKYRDGLRAKGLVPVLCWVLPDNKAKLKKTEAQLRTKLPR